jgi:magnesium transporter
VASFYGMNVGLPVQDSRYAFPIILLIALVISLLLGWYFLRKRLF